VSVILCASRSSESISSYRHSLFILYSAIVEQVLKKLTLKVTWSIKIIPILNGLIGQYLT